MTALVRRFAVERLAQEPAAAAPPPPPGDAPPPQGEDTPCTGCGCTKAECKGAGPCCEKCSHDIARAEEPRDVAAATTATAAKESRVRTFVASSEAVDRYNTVIKAAGWELGNYNRNRVVLFGHEGRSLPIGKGTPRLEGNRLLLDVEFLPADVSPLAEQALRIVDMGLMGASVGFNPIDWVWNEDRETGTDKDWYLPPLDYTRSELLEVSIVTIPANPEALPVGREVVAQRMEQRAAKAAEAERLHPAALQRLVPGLVREALAEVAAELRASRARKTGRIS
jgi:HK97 family phage prohead protease